MERIQKRIASCGVASRRKAEELIKEGRVKVNGVLVESLGYKLNPNDEVTIDDVIISKVQKQYYVLNKPRAVISTVDDEHSRKTVLDFCSPEILKDRIYPVGRLDYDTKGVILLTNDGDFMNRMVGPQSGIQKEYLVRIKGIITKQEIEKLEKGIILNGKKTLPAIVYLESIDRKNNSCLVRITITEGVNHQIKDMFSSIGHDVKRLTRVRFGNIRIDDLHEGEIRKLTPHEIKVLYELSKASKILKKDNFVRGRN